MFVHSFAIISASTVDTVANALSTHWQNCLQTGDAYPLKAAFNVSVAYNEVTVANIINQEPPDPRLGAARHVFFTPITGSGGGQMLPSQCALAVSVTAGYRPNGVPAKGRFYLPAPTTNILSPTDGTVDPTKRDQISATIAQFWADMNLAGHRPALWSRTYGTVVEWDTIRVGSKVDTIRRRRNELPEAYSTAVAVP